MKQWDALYADILALGAHRVGLVPVEKISFDPAFRKLCEQNGCGQYGKNWMCPPAVGDICALIQEAKGYSVAVVYQTVSQLEDSFDFEGMMEAQSRFQALAARVRSLIQPHHPEALFLGAGACTHCTCCAKLDEQPCRAPEKAVPSMEAYGINVSLLAPQAGMKYINGTDTVTYFGAVLM